MKSLIRYEHYVRERDIYLRLTERAVDNVRGFAVPRMIDVHDELLVIEMTVVMPPFVLDFAGAYLDQRPPYADDPEKMAEWEQEKIEQFGEEKWEKVCEVMSSFRGLGIYLSDLKPGNIEFAS